MSNTIIVISPPTAVPGEITKVIALFKLGLQQFHVRKPDFDDFDMMNYITSIPKEYRHRLVLHSHYHLAMEFKLKGIQVGKNREVEAKEYLNQFKYVGYSAHDFEEVKQKKSLYTHFFLSPIFNSISKPGYKASLSTGEISTFISNNKDIELIALGGININNCKECLKYGFKGIALLGSIWENDLGETVFTDIRKKFQQRPKVLSIAGFDPCAGAGVTADLKTFEQHNTLGLGVSTSITYQNEDEFRSVDWLSPGQVKKQIDVLLSKYKVDCVKIGLIENFGLLKQIISWIKSYNQNTKIIWDPILRATTNFNFHNNINEEELFEILKEIFLLTPNLPECQALFNTNSIEQIQGLIKKHALSNMLVKGGHSLNSKGTDTLIETVSVTTFQGKPLPKMDKHGTGCVLSSSICANLAKGLPLNESINRAKDYVANFICSDTGKLGFHNTLNEMAT